MADSRPIEAIEAPELVCDTFPGRVEAVLGLRLPNDELNWDCGRETDEL